MLRWIDDFLNKITMYRLVLYGLIALLAIAAFFGFIGIMPYNPISIAYSAIFITVACLLVNMLCAWIFRAPVNVESVYITALILALIITPIKTPDWQYLIFVGWAAVWAMVSKYILAIKKKHIFNPAAFAVALTALTINQSASWWVGTVAMLPFVTIISFLIIRKIKRFDLVFGFLIAAAVAVIGLSAIQGQSASKAAYNLLVSSPLIFFAGVMLTEPLTTPPTKYLRVAYGALVGLLFAPQVHIGNIYSTPELALLVGNVFSYLISPKQKLILALQRKDQLTDSIYDFVFQVGERMKFRPGQYLEWTIDSQSSDGRGNRRYFTIASSPTENEMIIGVKFYQPASSFKKSMLNMQPGQMIVASQLAGDFVLPNDSQKKLAFIAGGIGITPFRSMIKYLIDKNQQRDAVLFYSNRSTADIVYTDVLDQAQEQLGIRTVYTVTNERPDSPWQGYRGQITAEMLIKEMPDYLEREFYLSGPRAMIVAFEDTLRDLGVSRHNIKTDFFPGFA